MFFYKHSVFQSKARICLGFSQIQPQNMLKICLSKNIQKSKSHNLAHAWWREIGIGYQYEESLKFVPSRLLKSLV